MTDARTANGSLASALDAVPRRPGRARTTPRQEPAPRRRKTHAAAQSRAREWLPPGWARATMFGIVTVLGLDHPFVGAGDTPPPPPDLRPATPAARGSSGDPSNAGDRTPAPPSSNRPPAHPPATSPTPPARGAPEPIVLTATPVVQTVTVTVPSQATTPRRSSTPSQQASSPLRRPHRRPPTGSHHERQQLSHAHHDEQPEPHLPGDGQHDHGVDRRRSPRRVGSGRARSDSSNARGAGSSTPATSAASTITPTPGFPSRPTPSA